MLITRENAKSLSIAFAIAALLVFLVKMFIAQPSQLMVGFLDLLEFALALAIGFLLQIMVSSDQFRQEFHRFAVSAYRRIADIASSVVEMHQDIARLGRPGGEPHAHAFDVILARAQEVRRQVLSSQDDWRDFLRREIPALEEIERRRDRIRDVAAQAEGDEQENDEEFIQAMREEIRHFANELPMSLKTIIDIERGDVLPREGRHSAVVESFLRNSIREGGHITFPVDTRGELTVERIEQIRQAAPYSFFIEGAMGTEYFVIIGSDGEQIGTVANPFDTIYEKDFYFTLLQFLPTEPAEMVEGLHGMPVATIPGSEFETAAENWDRHIYIRVPVREPQQAA